jgi:hypothetical protein
MLLGICTDFVKMVSGSAKSTLLLIRSKPVQLGSSNYRSTLAQLVPLASTSNDLDSNILVTAFHSQHLDRGFLGHGALDRKIWGIDDRLDLRSSNTKN